jgi:hypothetical protein
MEPVLGLILWQQKMKEVPKNIPEIINFSKKAQENSIYTLKKGGMLKNISKKTYNCCKKQGDI